MTSELNMTCLMMRCPPTDENPEDFQISVASFISIWVNHCHCLCACAAVTKTYQNIFSFFYLNYINIIISSISFKGT